MNKLNIVMYHYVRPILESNFPRIKGLELEGFNRQLDYLNEHYEIITVDQIKLAISGKAQLPKNSCWLTFDDGYKDHFQFVYPELKKRNLEGTFFPPAGAILENKLLDVNAIHYILASACNIKDLKTNLNEICINNGFKKEKLNFLWKEYGIPNRFDNGDTIYIKRLLQHALPEDIRNDATKELFNKYVGMDPADFCSKLYMSSNEVQELISSGMQVGSHSNNHYCLDKLTPEKQEEDLNQSLNFLENVGASTTDWMLCYPYGAYNQSTLRIAKKLGAKIGVTTRVAIANLNSDHFLELPRFDTNDFPQ